MILSTILTLLPLLATITAHGCFPYNCGLGAGEDVCHDECSPLIVRPVDLPKPVQPGPKVVCKSVGGIPPLVPIRGPCTCHNPIVTPAQLPQPPCLTCGCGGSIDLSSDHQLSLSQKQKILYGGATGPFCHYGHHHHAAVARPILADDVPLGPGNPANYVPADPVSLHVAYKLAQESCHHNEDKLSFGFRSIPKEIPLYIRRSGVNVPEENLFSLNGQIVELKTKKCGQVKSLDDEAAEQLIQLQEEEDEENLDAGLLKQISLGEIGYAPANIKQPEFINLKPTGGLADDGLSAAIKDCKDGFKPGSVVIKEIPDKESYVLPPILPEPCIGDGEHFLPPGAVYPSPCNTFVSSASQLSASNFYKQNVFSHNVGCGCAK